MVDPNSSYVSYEVPESSLKEDVSLEDKNEEKKVTV